MIKEILLFVVWWIIYFFIVGISLQVIIEMLSLSISEDAVAIVTLLSATAFTIMKISVKELIIFIIAILLILKVWKKASPTLSTQLNPTNSENTNNPKNSSDKKLIQEKDEKDIVTFLKKSNFNFALIVNAQKDKIIKETKKQVQLTLDF